MCYEYFLKWIICGDNFTNFKHVKINGYFADLILRLTAILQTLNKLRLVDISG